MKFIVSIALLSFFSLQSNAQEKSSTTSQPDPAKKIQVVDASCGQCKFKLNGNGCDLAVKIDGKAYFVDGTNINDHGDAHAADGFCESTRKAEVQGEIVDNRFKATYFKLVKEKSKKEKKSS